MLTVFTIPKPFRSHIGIIQRNAIASWRALRPSPEIVLFGDEEGTALAARELGVRHEPEISANQYGTPLLNDLFRRAEAKSSSRTLCYVNADIILLSDFRRAVDRISSSLEKFLIVSKRINVAITEPLAFSGEWEATLQQQTQATGISGEHTSIDVFAFSRGIYPYIPEFGIGRLWFDQWLIKAARKSRIPVIDFSQVAPVLHQNHNYNHVAGGAKSIWNGEEAEHNLKLYGGTEHAYTLLDVTHELLPNGKLKRVLLRRFQYELWKLAIQKTSRVRHRLGIRRRDE